MPSRRILFLILLIILTALGLSSCLVKRRLITRVGSKSSQPTLLQASRSELIQKVVEQFNAIQNLSATVDMTPALGTAEKSRITEYKDVRGYIRFRKPGDIHIVGLYPVVRNTAFDMVSNGMNFKLHIVAKNLVITGSNEIIQPSPNKIENLRPQHFVDALLVKPLGAGDRVALENLTDEDNADYILDIFRDASVQELEPSRQIWFNRLDLTIARQIIFDPDGNILTDARYSDWQEYDNVPFPKHIEINRPRDEYAVVLNVVKLDVNKGVPDDQFVMNTPEGATVHVIGQGTSAAPAGSQIPSRGSNR